MIKKIVSGVWKIKSDCNVYIIDGDKKIVIDTGKRSERHNISLPLRHVISPDKVDIVILTHLHYDHIGNLDLFSNAKIYASKEEIEDFEKNDYGAVLDTETLSKIKGIKFHPIPNILEGLHIIHTPGHTRGSICVWEPKHKILFSGDTLFNHTVFGRTDLPTSDEERLIPSIIKLSRKCHYEHLCPGHNY